MGNIGGWKGYECYVIGYISGPHGDSENIAEIEQTQKQSVFNNE